MEFERTNFESLICQILTNRVFVDDEKRSSKTTCPVLLKP